ncbi:NAD(P)H-dependent oxidoreductase [Psychromarinibacter sp. S121]|uniref:NAD(P)H-dependent oxidoreductase n=1 Tax=Psychromarinibacter sp. S121 TaxID=3415127 RepID=UPI003C7D3BEB
MAKLLIYYAHPGQRFSRANAAMWARAQTVEDATCVDLYAEYPRFDIDVDREQQRLLDHDVIVFQFPVFWYSTPSLLKEWQDLVLEHGFAYGHEGTRLAGKAMQLAVTTAGPETAYAPGGHNRYPIRDYLRPLEQTAFLCNMTFLAPLVLFGALKAENSGQIEQNAETYGWLLDGLSSGRVPVEEAAPDAVLTHETLRERV